MKKHVYLALKLHEFLEMVEVIARERQTLKVKKKTDDSITITCHVGIPVSHIRYEASEEKDNLLVNRKLNLFPLFYSTIPIFILLEIMVFIISYFRNGDNIFIYFLISLAWIIALAFLIYQTFVDLEEIDKKLYRIEV